MSLEDRNKRNRDRYKENPDIQRKRNERYVSKDLEAYREKVRSRVRKYRLKHKYKITQEKWDELFTSQGNACAVCRATSSGSKNFWHTDHCHDTGKVRGILCHACNANILRKGVTPSILRAAADYLER